MQINVKSPSHWLELFLKFKQVIFYHFRTKRGKKDLFSWKNNISESNVKQNSKGNSICGEKQKTLKFHLRLCSARVGDALYLYSYTWQVHSKGTDIVILLKSSIAKVMDWPRKWLYFDPRISLSWKLNAILII